VVGVVAFRRPTTLAPRTAASHERAGLRLALVFLTAVGFGFDFRHAAFAAVFVFDFGFGLTNSWLSHTSATTVSP
jgi:hypothetical protein